MSRKLHPLIHKYWEDQGYVVHIETDRMMTIRVSKADMYCIVGSITNDRYWISSKPSFSSDDTPHTEEKFLKLIKLKAFL
jgi:hypothetical protein